MDTVASSGEVAECNQLKSPLALLHMHGRASWQAHFFHSKGNKTTTILIFRSLNTSENIIHIHTL